MRKTTLGLGIALSGLAFGSYAASLDSFNVNFSDANANRQLGAGDTAAGIYDTPATDWQNTSGDATLTSVNGATATLDVRRQRNAGSVNRVNLANDGNATLYDYKLHGTGTEGAAPNSGALYFGERIVDFIVTDIPFEEYEVVLYISYTPGQYNGSANSLWSGEEGRANIRINENVVDLATLDAIDYSRYSSDLPNNGNNTDWATVIPIGDGGDGSLTYGQEYRDLARTRPGEFEFFMPRFDSGGEIDTDLLLDELVIGSDASGNYIKFTGLTDSAFEAQIWGEHFVHAGPAGFQIIEVPEPSSLALVGLGGLLIARRRRG